ncbi:MAG TPA: response regulator [Aggregatilineales bacterium]|nr:response regulator [Aggregatilineales bacterium]
MGVKLLIVDDEPFTVEMISTYLQMNGFECTGAHSGTDGLALLKNTNPALVILDLMMPDIEGFEFCERMRSDPQFATIPVLIVSARTDQEAMDRAFNAGANDYLTKPFQLAELMGAVKTLLGG